MRIPSILFTGERQPLRQFAPGRDRARRSIVFMFLSLALPVCSAVAIDEDGSPALQPEPPRIKYQKSEVFLTAQAAYDAGRYDEAAALYGQLADSGVDNTELHYNLANALFKGGDLPGAVLHYRQAWHDAPRDPDIRANLHFALSAAGAIDPALTRLEQVYTALPENGWILAATGSYAATVFLLILCLRIRPARRTLLKLSLLPVLIILVSVGGWRYWQQLKTHPEWVVTRSGATALFGPIEGATAHYKLPLAALVRQRGTDSKGWIEIEYDGKRGWLQASYIKRVYP